MNQQTVLIITDDVNFSRTLTSVWQAEHAAPIFKLSNAGFPGSGRGPAPRPAFALVIIGPIVARQLDLLLMLPQAEAQPVVCVVAREYPLQLLRARHPRVTFVRESKDCEDVVVLLGKEILDRTEAVERACRAERAVAARERYATLGRYALDMRHSFNNALTSVLGNAELMLLEPGALSSDVWEQVQTIHGMALRMHELIQRLTSLEAEMNLSAKESLNEARRPMHDCVA